MSSKQKSDFIKTFGARLVRLIEIQSKDEFEQNIIIQNLLLRFDNLFDTDVFKQCLSDAKLMAEVELAKKLKFEIYEKQHQLDKLNESVSKRQKQINESLLNDGQDEMFSQDIAMNSYDRGNSSTQLDTINSEINSPINSSIQANSSDGQLNH